VELAATLPSRSPGELPVLARLIALWQQSSGTDLRRFLDDAAPLPPADLVAVVLYDQRQRWQHGDRRPAETYLDLCPELHQSGGAFELILAEWLLLRQAGATPVLAEFEQRFPRYAAALRHQLERQGLLPAGGSQGDTHACTPPLNRARKSGPRARPAPLQIPGYQILGELGRGGMGVVYKAWQTDLQRPVALKMILAGRCASAEDVSRLRSEAQSVARLQHPGIVQVYEIGEHEGLPFYSLELVEGCTLAERLQNRPQSPHGSAALVELLAWAVQHAHQQGVVHRDLKPANVLLGGPRDQPLADAIPKITDFGVAKRLDDVSNRTRTGVIVGTPNYMAPEQATGLPHAVGPAADIYALGAILYELLTGRPPFQCGASTDTLLQVLNSDPVPPRRLQADVPRDLETICLKCLHKDPQRRYASAAHLAEDLRRFLRREPIQARPVGRTERLVKWARRRPAVAGLSSALLLLAAVGLASVLALWRNAELMAAEQSIARQNAEAAEGKAKKNADDASANAVRASNNAAAADRERLKFEKSFAEALLNQGLALCEKGEVPWGLLVLARCLEITTRLEEETGPSPLTPVLRRNLALWESQLVREVHAFRHHSWVWAVAHSPDGKTIATAGYDRKLQVWDAHTGERLGPPLPHPGPVWCVAFSPDGRWLVSGCGPASRDDDLAHAYVWRLTPGQPPVAAGKLPHRGHVKDITFSPDGKRLLVRHEMELDASVFSLWPAPSDAAPVPLVIGAPLGSMWAPLRAAVFSPDSRRFLTVGMDGRTRLHDAATAAVVGELPRKNHPIVAAAFRPDGKQFVTVNLVPMPETRSEVGHEAHLWDMATGKRVASTAHREGEAKAVAFAPDGRSFVTATALFDGIRERKDGEVFLKRVAGGGEVHVWQADALGQPGLCQPLAAPLKHTMPVWAVAFSPNGRLLATGSEDGKLRLFQTAGYMLFTQHKAEGTVRSLAFSSDGRTLVMGSAGGNQLVLARVLQVPATLPRVTLRLSERHPGEPCLWGLQWSADGKYVAVNLDREGEKFGMPFWDAATGRPHTPLPDGRICRFASPDLGVMLAMDKTGEYQFFRRDPLTPLGKLPKTQKVDQATFSASGRLAALHRDTHGVIRIYDTATGAQVCPDLLIPEMCTTRLAFSPDERYLVAGMYYRFAQDLQGSFFFAWEVATGKQLNKTELSGEINGVEFSPDGKLLVTGDGNKRVQRWDATVGLERVRTRPVGQALLHQEGVAAVAVSHDSRLLLSASSDETARLWDAATGAALGPTLRHNFRCSAVVFAPDGLRLATAHGQGPIVVWDLPPPAAGTPEQLRHRVEGLTGLRLDENNFPQQLPAAEYLALRRTALRN
jgi:WD40 repeat protein